MEKIEATEKQFMEICSYLKGLVKQGSLVPTLMACWADEDYEDISDTHSVTDPEVKHYNVFGAFRLACLHVFSVHSPGNIWYKGHNLKWLMAEKFYTFMQQSAITFFEGMEHAENEVPN